ncbi:MAG: hypothetical protein MUF72_00845 [Elainella sp. Prado103]|jgi:hypothetical protein|nr:hypothetical protein [Elainella sp. Prado103]
MTTGLKSQIATELQKAKQIGGTRAEKIRQIFQEAMVQTLSELKEGSGEIQTIAKGSASTLFDSLKEIPKTERSPKPTEFQPIEVEIEVEIEEDTVMATDHTNLDDHQPIESEISTNLSADPSSIPTEAIITVTPIEDASVNVSANSVVVDAVVLEPRQAEPVQTEPIPAEPVAATAPMEENSTSETVGEIADKVIALAKDLLNKAHSRLRQQEIYAELQQQLTKLKGQLGVIDTKLSDRYGDRYENIKQDFQQDWEKTKGWYSGMKAKAQAEGSHWVDQKQAEAHVQAGEAGMSIAQKEQKIKQLLKELWHTVRS